MSQAEGAVSAKSLGYLACLRINKEANVAGAEWAGAGEQGEGRDQKGEIMWSLKSYWKDFASELRDMESHGRVLSIELMFKKEALQ